MRKQLICGLLTGMLATVVALLPGSAWAVGLGQIESKTHIGQNLEARIPILAAGRGAAEGLTVGLATPDAYRQAGIREADFLFDLKFQVKQGANGPYVLVTSSQPVRRPFLDILVHAHWSSGDVTRRYTLLLNPPVFASAHAERARGGRHVAMPSTRSRQTPIERPSRPQSRPEAQSPVAPRYAQEQAAPAGEAHAGVYGPVQRGQTLWGIAQGLSAGSGASVNQMMIALYRANPGAFAGNVNRLKAGATLHVPARAKIGQISRAAAGAEVAKQVKAWRAAKTRHATQSQPEKAVAATGAGTATVAKRAGTQPTSAAQGGASGGNTAGQSAGTPSGQVVLTAPTLTRSVAAGPVAAAASSGGPVTAAGAAVAAAARSNGAGAAANNQSARASSLPAASAGGPARVHNAALANLAAAGAARPGTAGGQAARASNAGTAAAAGNTTPGQPRKLEATAGTGASGGLAGTVWNWLTSPKGWIVIALIVIWIAVMIFLLVRRRRRNEDRAPTAVAAGGAAAIGPAPAGTEDTELAGADAAAPRETEPAATPDEVAPTPAFAGAAAPANPEDTELADLLAEADRCSHRGDYAEAARLWSQALEGAPGRTDVRMRLLGALYATGDGAAFRAEAEALHGQVAESSDDWQAAATMGRELLPADPLFVAGGGSAGVAPERLSPETSDRSADDEAADFELELAQLDEDQEETIPADEFERTLGELSTMIETYMPESGGPPIGVQLPPEESAARAEQNLDDALEFEPVEEEPDRTAEADPEPGGRAGSEEREDPSEGRSTGERMQLHLAQAYLDMDDRDSARATLEDAVSEGDATLRDRARLMLAAMDDGAGDATETVSEASASGGESTAEAPVDEAPAGTEESGTAIDLARAYLELGDRESARDILEEVLDGESEPQRERARELLETLDA